MRQTTGTWVEQLVADIRDKFVDYFGPEKREYKREELPPLPVMVQPLNEHLNPTGRAFSAVMRNISAAGIGLSLGEHVDSDLIQIEGVLPSGKILKAVIRVRHCTPAGVMIGGEFIESQPPEMI